MVTCNECGGECCKKLAFQIDNPVNIIDYEDMKWYLYHENTMIYIDPHGDWLVQIPVKCTKLDKNGKCTIYEKRPPICRFSHVKDCEKNINEMAVVFNTVQDIERYMKEKNII